MTDKPDRIPERPFDDGIIRHPEPDPFAQSVPGRLNREGRRGCIGSLIVMFVPYNVCVLICRLMGGCGPDIGLTFFFAVTFLASAVAGILFITLDRFKEK